MKKKKNECSCSTKAPEFECSIGHSYFHLRSHYFFTPGEHDALDEDGNVIGKAIVTETDVTVTFNDRHKFYTLKK